LRGSICGKWGRNLINRNKQKKLQGKFVAQETSRRKLAHLRMRRDQWGKVKAGVSSNCPTGCYRSAGCPRHGRGVPSKKKKKRGEFGGRGESLARKKRGARQGLERKEKLSKSIPTAWGNVKIREGKNAKGVMTPRYFDAQRGRRVNHDLEERCGANGLKEVKAEGGDLSPGWQKMIGN